MSRLERFRAWRAERRAKRAVVLAEQAKLKAERNARGLPGAETHGTPPDTFGVHGS
jgi:hypothetical protein